MQVTEALIREGQSSNGGWSKNQLLLLGIDWPPEKGWISRVAGRKIGDADARAFIELKDRHLRDHRHV